MSEITNAKKHQDSQDGKDYERPCEEFVTKSSRLHDQVPIGRPLHHNSMSLGQPRVY